MLVSVILAHPDQHSFNHAIAAKAMAELDKSGHRVNFHDLYAEQFSPMLTSSEIARDTQLEPVIQQHCTEVSQAEGLVIVHPNWWGGPPAILKGWVDRVIRPGVAYEFNEGDSGEGIPNGLLKIKTALVFNTSNTYTERERMYSETLLKHSGKLRIRIMRSEQLPAAYFGVIVTSSPEQRKAWLNETGEIVRRLFLHPDLIINKSRIF
jgi:putative NADPH-quinone reductase